MKKTQLDNNIAQKIIDDNPQYRFLRTLLPLYINYKRSRKAAGNSELELVHGWVARYQGDRLMINREPFYLDEEDYVVVQKPEVENAWYLGLRGCEKPDDLINFKYVKNISPHTMMVYGLDDTVPELKNQAYLKLGN